MLPLLKQVLSLLDEFPAQSRLCDVLLLLKQLANIHGLAAPEVAMHAPVEGELEGPPVEAQHVDAGAHGQWQRQLGAFGVL